MRYRVLKGERWAIGLAAAGSAACSTVMFALFGLLFAEPTVSYSLVSAAIFAVLLAVAGVWLVPAQLNARLDLVDGDTDEERIQILRAVWGGPVPHEDATRRAAVAHLERRVAGLRASQWAVTALSAVVAVAYLVWGPAHPWDGILAGAWLLLPLYTWLVLPWTMRRRLERMRSGP